MSYNTKQKEKILQIIRNYNRDFTIKDIYNKLNGEIGLTTIYRFIDKLYKDGRLNKHVENDNEAYYEYLEECDNDNHFYLKCENCKDLIHVDCDCVGDLWNHINEKHRFKANKDKIIINGICESCLKEGGK